MTHLLEDEDAAILSDFYASLPYKEGEEPIFPPKWHTMPDSKLKPIVVSAKVGRNDPCPCGSGKKHKKCCL